MNTSATLLIGGWRTGECRFELLSRLSGHFPKTFDLGSRATSSPVQVRANGFSSRDGKPYLSRYTRPDYCYTNLPQCLRVRLPSILCLALFQNQRIPTQAQIRRSFRIGSSLADDFLRRLSLSSPPPAQPSHYSPPSPQQLISSIRLVQSSLPEGPPATGSRPSVPTPTGSYPGGNAIASLWGHVCSPITTVHRARTTIRAGPRLERGNIFPVSSSQSHHQHSYGHSREVHTPATAEAHHQDSSGPSSDQAQWPPHSGMPVLNHPIPIFVPGSRHRRLLPGHILHISPSQYSSQPPGPVDSSLWFPQVLF